MEQHLAKPSDGGEVSADPNSTSADQDVPRLSMDTAPTTALQSKHASRDTPELSVARGLEILHLRKVMAGLVEELGPLNTETKAGRYVARKGYFRGLAAMYGRWVFNQKISEGHMLDPLLPSHAPVDTMQLPKELVEAGLKAEDAERISSLLSEESRKAADRMAALVAEPSWDRSAAAIRRSEKGGLVRLGFDGTEVVISQAHYSKLCRLWDRRCSSADDEGGRANWASRNRNARQASAGAQRDEDIFCVLQRYEALNGESPGFQMAIPEAVFDVLQRNWGVSHECFASPLNCYFPDFCSLFADTDACFGSRGSFFEFCPTEGSYESNPPFVEDTMAKGAKHIIRLLGDSDKPLSFVIIVPGWEDGCESYELVTRSPFLRHWITLGKDEHYYKNGMQHSVVGRGVYQRSTCSTFIFFMQNDPGAAKWPAVAGDSRMQELVDRFCTVPRERPQQGHAAIAPLAVDRATWRNPGSKQEPKVSERW